MVGDLVPLVSLFPHSAQHMAQHKFWGRPWGLGAQCSFFPTPSFFF